MKENINLQLCNMSIILFSFLIIPFCFINNIYVVNGVSTNVDDMNIKNNVDKLVDHISEIKNELDKEINQFDKTINKINKQLEKI